MAGTFFWKQATLAFGRGLFTTFHFIMFNICKSLTYKRPLLFCRFLQILTTHLCYHNQYTITSGEYMISKFFVINLLIPISSTIKVI